MKMVMVALLLAQLPSFAAVASATMAARSNGRAASRGVKSHTKGSKRHGATALEPATFGPIGCVSLGRSAVGSCILSTNCEGQDITKFEFAFDCEGQTGGIVRHSFGTGGFDDNEDFDTEVNCKTCYVPSPWAPKSVPMPAAPQTATPTAPKSVAAAAPQTATPAAASQVHENTAAVSMQGSSIGAGDATSAQIVAAVVKAAEHPMGDAEDKATQMAAREEQAKINEKEEIAREEVARRAADEASRKAAAEEEVASKATAREEEASLNAAAAKAALAASAPAPAAVHAPVTPTYQEPTFGGIPTQGNAESKAVFYGPRKCVSTYRSPDGHCVLKTACDAMDIKNYEFGLLCVEAGGVSVRHLFGQDSFDPEETFDTLISCAKCEGLDDMSSDAALTGRVNALSSEVQGLKVALANLTHDIIVLNNYTALGGSAQESAAASAAVNFAGRGPVAPMNKHLRQQFQMNARNPNRWNGPADANAEESDVEETRPHHTRFLHRRQSLHSAPKKHHKKHRVATNEDAQVAKTVEDTPMTEAQNEVESMLDGDQSMNPPPNPPATDLSESDDSDQPNVVPTDVSTAATHDVEGDDDDAVETIGNVDDGEDQADDGN